MIRSMTGFGRGEALVGEAPLAAEVRSVNGRHLEFRMRGVRDLVGSDAWVRDLLGAQFRRGQVDVQLRLGGVRRESEVELDLDVARSYLAAAEELRRSASAGGSLAIAELLTLPGVARLREREPEPEALAQAARAALEAAGKEAAEMRAREGQALERQLRQALGVIAELLDRVEARADEVRGALRERLRQRVREAAPDLELPAGRLEQEVVFYLDRMDITEESVRLRSHLDQFAETLESDGPVGRKLEFLLQEMGREVNTIGSKGSDAPISHCVVDLKGQLEQLREQVLNVE